jgi:hypothetical protein
VIAYPSGALYNEGLLTLIANIIFDCKKSYHGQTIVLFKSSVSDEEKVL